MCGGGGGGGGAEWQLCSQLCTRRVGDVCVCVCVCVCEGLQDQSCGQHTLQENTDSDTLHSETLSLSLSLACSFAHSVKLGSCFYLSCLAGKQMGLGSIPLQLSLLALQ